MITLAGTEEQKELGRQLNNQILELTKAGVSQATAHLQVCEKLGVDPDDAYDYLDLVQTRPYGAEWEEL